MQAFNRNSDDDNITFTLTTIASLPTIVPLKFFHLGTGWDHQISRNLCCLSDAVKSICTVWNGTFGTLFCEKVVLEKNAAVTHMEWVLAFQGLLVRGRAAQIRSPCWLMVILTKGLDGSPPLQRVGELGSLK